MRDAPARVTTRKAAVNAVAITLDDKIWMHYAEPLFLEPSSGARSAPPRGDFGVGAPSAATVAGALTICKKHLLLGS